MYALAGEIKIEAEASAARGREREKIGKNQLCDICQPICSLRHFTMESRRRFGITGFVNA